MSGLLEFRLLGPVEVRAGGRLVKVGPPRQRAVLAALAVDVGRAVMVDTVVDRVWGAATPVRVRDALYVYITRLRRVLEDAGAASLVRRSGGYLLSADPESVDLYRFRRLAGRAGDPKCPDLERVALLRRALDLRQGTPLADLPGDWAARVREGEVPRV